MLIKFHLFCFLSFSGVRVTGGYQVPLQRLT